MSNVEEQHSQVDVAPVEVNSIEHWVRRLFAGQGLGSGAGHRLIPGRKLCFKAVVLSCQLCCKRSEMHDVFYTRACWDERGCRGTGYADYVGFAD